MLTLTIRTDKPEAEIGLYNDGEQLAYETWQAHRQLAETIHTKINELLKSQHKTLQDLNGVVAFKGPGSFTGLRIGLSVANALAYGLQIPIIARQGDDWITSGIEDIRHHQNQSIALPAYGAQPNITAPRH